MVNSDILAKLCNTVDRKYKNDEAILAILKDQPLSDIRLTWLNVLIVESLIINTAQGDIFIFKSTDSKEDWDDNYKFFPTRFDKSYPTCCFGCCSDKMVHTGFKKQFDIIFPELLKHITHTKAIFTGFSLGAALATLTAYSMDYKSKELITFGSPKVGNSYFVEELNSKLKRNERWVYQNDVIPSLPPGGYYQHVGTLNLLYNNKLLHSQKQGFFALCTNNNTEDHNLDLYIPAMEPFT